LPFLALLQTNPQVKKKTKKGAAPSSTDAGSVCDHCHFMSINYDQFLQNNVLLFLHGFLGSSEDWIPIMKSLSRSAKCISVDLPGHGKSKIQSRNGVNAMEYVSLSIDVVAAVLSQLIDKVAPGKVTLVGYSMGARMALYMALRCSGKVYS